MQEKRLGDDAFEFVSYEDEGAGVVPLRLERDTQTLWATQAQIAELFQTDQSGVSRHLKSILDEGELQAEGNMQKVHTSGSAKPFTRPL